MATARPAPAAVLFDRDGTLIHDAPGCVRDHSLIQPIEGVREAVGRVSARGIPVGVVTNQAVIGRGCVGEDEVGAVNAVVDALVGPFATWQVCPHTPEQGCRCRKPRPGLVHRAARALQVDPAAVVVIGDIESDVRAAEAIGAVGILVPTQHTRPDEVARARHAAPDIAAAVAMALGER